VAATEAHAGRPETLTRSPRVFAAFDAVMASLVALGVHASAVERPPAASRFPPPDPVARLERERIASFHAGVLAATLRRDAPARCGGFVDERRIVVGDGGRRRRPLVSQTSVCVPDRVALRGACLREAELATSPFTSAAHRHLPVRCARALRRVRR
jgi:hypothetical protein